MSGVKIKYYDHGVVIYIKKSEYDQNPQWWNKVIDLLEEIGKRPYESDKDWKSII